MKIDSDEFSNLLTLMVFYGGVKNLPNNILELLFKEKEWVLAIIESHIIYLRAQKSTKIRSKIVNDLKFLTEHIGVENLPQDIAAELFNIVFKVE